MRFILFSFLIMIGMGNARAHDEWLNGHPVDPKTKQLCCGAQDCKPVDQIHMRLGNDGEYHFDDTEYTFPLEYVQPSPDGTIWRCIWGGRIRCLFVPDPTG